MVCPFYHLVTNKTLVPYLMASTVQILYYSQLVYVEQRFSLLTIKAGRPEYSGSLKIVRMKPFTQFSSNVWFHPLYKVNDQVFNSCIVKLIQVIINGSRQ